MTIGTTIIAERDRDRIATIRSTEDLDKFNCLYLDVLITLDFEMMLRDSDLQWVAGQPIFYDPEGLAVFELDTSGLNAVLQQVTNLDDRQQADIRKLADFVRAHPKSSFYEFGTF